MLDSPLVSQFGYVEQRRFREALFDLRCGKLSPHVPTLLKALSLELWLRDVVERGVVSTSLPHPGCGSLVQPAVSALKAVS